MSKENVRDFGTLDVPDVDSDAACLNQGSFANPKENDDLENRDSGLQHDDMYIPSAIADDPDARPPQARNGRFLIYLCLALAAVFIGTIGTVLGITLTNEEIPPSVPYRATLGIRENVARIVGNEQLDDHKSAYRKALDWIMFDDPAATTPENPKFIQRYLLAYLFFATSVKKPWDTGCAPASDKEVSCEYDFAFTYESDGTFRNATVTGFRWLSSVDECIWAGIDCDPSNQIRGINLGGNGMTGTFPEGILLLPFLQLLRLAAGALEGPLPESLWKYKYVHSIALESNGFIGTLPDAWYKFRSLHTILLSSNHLSGTISEKISTWKDTFDLFLNDNLFEGTIPNDIGYLMNIHQLSANRNNLNGTIPSTIGNLHHVDEIDLSGNKVTGTIPTEIGTCQNLVTLDLDDNLLTGSIPDEFWMAQNLFTVSLGNNDLNGTISDKITTLSNLWELIIHDNQFTGNVPARMGRTSVTAIKASGNNFTGTVPDQICDLVGSGQLEDLELDCAAPREGGPVDIVCPCCTFCCTPNGQECYPTS